MPSLLPGPLPRHIPTPSLGAPSLPTSMEPFPVTFQEEALPSLEELARQIEDEELELSEKPQQYLQRVFEDSIYKPLVERSILDYLHYNYYHLPMYAWPGVV